MALRLLPVLFFAIILGLSFIPQVQVDNPPEENYKTYCASCHGEQMEAFVDRKWQYGSSKSALIKSIKYGNEDDGMPAYDTTFSDKEIKALAAYILKGKKKVDRYKFAGKFNDKQVFESEGMQYRLELVQDGLDNPWGMDFLPNGDMLITDRSGELYLRKSSGKLMEIEGVPGVKARGQGGMLDVELHPDFEKNSWIYLSYSKPQGSKATTAIMRAKLMGNQLSDKRIIFEAKPYFTTRHHYGSRLEFDQDGFLFLSVGDRGRRDQNPQSLDNHCGKIHRIYDDGRIPEDNPFVDVNGAMPSIYSYGHRNPQGLAMEPSTGVIWEHEHGPRGGDEINIIRKGKNYGWPVISYGINYNGTTFTEKTAQEGMEQPALYWVPSIAACGMTFVKGDRYPAWKGDILTGSLRFKYLNRSKVENGKIVGEELLLKNIGRLRNVEMSRDGYIYVAVEEPGKIYKIIPVKP